MKLKYLKWCSVSHIQTQHHLFHINQNIFQQPCILDKRSTCTIIKTHCSNRIFFRKFETKDMEHKGPFWRPLLHKSPGILFVLQLLPPFSRAISSHYRPQTQQQVSVYSWTSVLKWKPLTTFTPTSNASKDKPFFILLPNGVDQKYFNWKTKCMMSSVSEIATFYSILWKLFRKARTRFIMSHYVLYQSFKLNLCFFYVTEIVESLSLPQEELHVCIG